MLDPLPPRPMCASLDVTAVTACIGISDPGQSMSHSDGRWATLWAGACAHAAAYDEDMTTPTTPHHPRVRVGSLAAVPLCGRMICCGMGH